MKSNLLLFTVILVCTFSKGNSQNMEGFLRPYADAIVQEAAFEFTDKETGEKFSRTDKLPINQYFVIGNFNSMINKRRDFLNFPSLLNLLIFY